MPSSFHPSWSHFQYCSTGKLLATWWPKFPVGKYVEFCMPCEIKHLKTFSLHFQSCRNCLAVDCAVLAFHSRNQQAATSPQLQHAWALHGVSSMQKCRQRCPNLQEAWLCWIGLKKSFCQRAQKLKVHWKNGSTIYVAPLQHPLPLYVHDPWFFELRTPRHVIAP